MEQHVPNLESKLADPQSELHGDYWRSTKTHKALDKCLHSATPRALCPAHVPQVAKAVKPKIPNLPNNYSTRVYKLQYPHTISSQLNTRYIKAQVWARAAMPPDEFRLHWCFIGACESVCLRFATDFLATLDKTEAWTSTRPWCSNADCTWDQRARSMPPWMLCFPFCKMP